SEGYQALYAVQPELNPARDDLRTAEDRFGPNHLYYVAQLKRIQSDPKPLKAPEIVMQADGKPQLDTPVIGKPVFGKDAPLIAKSLNEYQKDLDRLVGKIDPDTRMKTIVGEIDKVEAEIKRLTGQEKELTEKLLGFKDDKGNPTKPGLYGL